MTIVAPPLVDPPEDGQRLVELGRVQPGEHLVEQQQRRPGRQCAGQLEHLALVEVDLAREGVGPPHRGPRPRGAPRALRRASSRLWLVRPNMQATATLSRTVIDSNGLGI